MQGVTTDCRRLEFAGVKHYIPPLTPDNHDNAMVNTLKYFSLVILAACVGSLCPMGASAQDNPVQLSLFTPVQIVDETESVTALRLSLIYGSNVNVTGFDWGLVAKNTGNGKGVQWAGVALVDNDFEGWQWSFVGITKGSFTGLQGMSAYNSAGYLNGVQIGLINSTETIKGVQVGLLNFIKSGGFMPFFPIVNWGGL